MNIGFFSDCWEPQINGVIVSMKNLEIALHERGHEVFHYAPAVHGDRVSTRTVFRQRAVTYPFQKEFSMAAPWHYQALRLARRQRLDLVHGHTEFSLGLVGAAVARRLNLPFVFTLHTLWTHYEHYVFWGLIPRRLLVSIMRRFYLKPDYYIAPSSKIKSYLEKEFNIAARIETIPTGLDLERFYRYTPTTADRLAFRNKYGLQASDRVMIFVGRIGREKSIDLLIKSLPALTAARPELKLLIVGDGPARGALEKLAASLGVRRSVAFTGYLERGLLPLAYKASDVFAIASATETQGLVTVEAMASGLPIVAREDEAQLDVLGTRENGLVFSDVPGFVRAMETLLSRTEFQACLAARSRERSAAFTLREFGARMEAFYRFVVDDFKRRKKSRSSNCI